MLFCWTFFFLKELGGGECSLEGVSGSGSNGLPSLIDFIAKECAIAAAAPVYYEFVALTNHNLAFALNDEVVTQFFVPGPLLLLPLSSLQRYLLFFLLNTTQHRRKQACVRNHTHSVNEASAARLTDAEVV